MYVWVKVLGLMASLDEAKQQDSVPLDEQVLADLISQLQPPDDNAPAEEKEMPAIEEKKVTLLSCNSTLADLAIAIPMVAPGLTLQLTKLIVELQPKMLVWKSTFIGLTDYIDSIQANEMTDAYMWGVDCFGRLFLSLRVRMYGRVGVQTIFQRYAFKPDLWVLGGHKPGILLPSRVVREEDVLSIAGLIRTGKMMSEDARGEVVITLDV